MDSKELSRQLSKEINRTNRYFNTICTKNNVNSNVLNILYSLYVDPGLTQKGLVDTLLLPKQTVNTIVKSLIVNGYVISKEDEKDHRMKCLYISSNGQDYLEAASINEMKVEDYTASIMGEEDLRQLIILSRKYADAVKQAIEELKL